MKLAAGFVLNQGLSRIVLYHPLYGSFLTDFVLRSTGKATGDHGNKWGGKTVLNLDYANEFSILDESVNKMNELLEALRVQGARIGWKINVKKTKSLRLGISEDEKVTLGNENIYRDSSRFNVTDLGSIISKDNGSSEDIKSKTTDVKYGPEAWALPKAIIPLHIRSNF